MEDSLAALYDRAWVLWQESNTDSDVCADGISAFRKVVSKVRLEAVFSKGEDADDLHTQSFKYLSVPFFLGDLLQNQPGMDGREERLKEAQRCFVEFLERLREYGLISKKDLASFERDSADVLPADLMREEVMERYRRTKAINERLMAIMKRKRNGGLDDADEELEREVAVSALELHVIKSLKSLKMIREELPILELMNKMKTTGVGPPGPPAERIDLWGPRRKPTKKETRDVVFRPGWNLPTMSIEEAGEIEMQYAVRGGGDQSVVKTYGDERGVGYIRCTGEVEEERSDDSEDDDKKVKEKREWDEFNDDNPTGWGNRHNRG